MKQKIKFGLTAVLIAPAILLFWNNASAFTETKSGSVESSYSVGSGVTNQSIIENFLTSHQGGGGNYHAFRAGLLAAVIEQTGEVSKYPTIYPIAKCVENLCDRTADPLDAFNNLQIYGITDLNTLGCVEDIQRNVISCIEGTTEGAGIKKWLGENNPGILDFLSKSWGNYGYTELWTTGTDIVSDINSLSCKHTNNYNYTFQYDVNQEDEWKPVSDATVNKCEEVKLTFSPAAEWLATLANSESSKSYHFIFTSPPTNIIACADQASCLSQATEYSLTSDTFGRGAQKVPADFVAQTEKSLTSPNAYMKCTDGVCVSYTSGSFPLTATAPASSYFGQCRGYGTTINTPEAAIPAVTSSTTVNIVNRPPVPTVTVAKNPIAANEEVDLTCDIVDPDECSDKIAKVKWTCADSNGSSDNCFLWKEGTGIWDHSAVQDLVTSEKSNPYRATAKFKAGQGGDYSVTCEAWDDDANNPLSGTGIAGVQVVSSCGEDGVCNPNCNPPDPDCSHCGADGICVQGCNPPDSDCVVAASSKYCALLSADSGSENTVCGEGGNVKYKAYVSGMEPATYQWKCSSDDSVKETTQPSFTCPYQASGTYLPSLSIVDKKGAQISCVTQTSTTVAKEGSCQLKVRKAGSGDDFTANANIDSGDQVEAKVEKKCVAGGSLQWEVTGGSVVSQDGSTAKIRFDNAGTGKIKSVINISDGKTLNCGEAKVKITEKVQFNL